MQAFGRGAGAGSPGRTPCQRGCCRQWARWSGRGPVGAAAGSLERPRARWSGRGRGNRGPRGNSGPRWELPPSPDSRYGPARRLRAVADRVVRHGHPGTIGRPSTAAPHSAAAPKCGRPRARPPSPWWPPAETATVAGRRLQTGSPPQGGRGSSRSPRPPGDHRPSRTSAPHTAAIQEHSRPTQPPQTAAAPNRSHPKPQPPQTAADPKRGQLRTRPAHSAADPQRAAGPQRGRPIARSSPLESAPSQPRSITATGARTTKERAACWKTDPWRALSHLSGSIDTGRLRSSV